MVAKKVLILDTSVLCCLLDVAGKATCGPEGDKWNKTRIEKLLATEKDATIVMPLASIIETGNHIAQAGARRFETATAFCEKLMAVADAKIPWAAFSEQADLWSPDSLRQIASDWPDLAKTGLSMGDATIKTVAEYYGKTGMSVEIITGDSGLKAYETIAPVLIPRRRG
jgi:hypothetical protein